jgi:hypothetical protein
VRVAVIHYAVDPRYGFGIVSPTRMLATDPAGWPDRNPLVAGAPRAVTRYPSSSYRSAAEPKAPASATPSAAASPSPAPSEASGEEGGGARVPATIAAVVLAAVAAAGALSLCRRRSAP